MQKTFLSVIFLFSMVFALSACQNSAEKEPVSAKEGIEHDEKGDYRKALPSLEKAANADNAEAAWYLGDMYRKGEGVEKDDTRSFKWYLKAAELGNRDAFYIVASYYYLGKGVEQDYSEALTWFKKALESRGDNASPDPEDKPVYIVLGSMYMLGHGTLLQDFSEAAKWLGKAAELGEPKAQGQMAFFYYSGQGVLMNDVKARYWAEKAAAQGDSMGEYTMAMLYQFRQEPPNMQKAIYYYEKAAAQKNFGASFQLGTIYENGIGVPKDLAKAHHYYKQAVKNGKRDYLIEALRDFENEHHLQSTD